MIKEFPVPMAMGKDQRGIMAGKLNLEEATHTFDQLVRHARPFPLFATTHGQIAAPTPNGLLLVYVSISVDTSTLSPKSILGKAHNESTTWRPRRTSPLASEWVLPCSRTMELARSSWW